MAKKQSKRSPGMKSWSRENLTHVSHMTSGDFYGSEKSHVMRAADSVKIVFRDASGAETVLKEGLKLQAGEVIDAATMSKTALTQFYADQIEDAKNKNMLLSLHLKATMMKVSDPIMFGHMVKVFYSDVFTKYGDLFNSLGVNPNNGLGDVYDKIRGHPQQTEVEAALAEVYNTRPGLAMVDSSKGE